MDMNAVNQAGRLWLLGNSDTLRTIGLRGYTTRGQGCVAVRLAASGRPIEEPLYRTATEIEVVDGHTAEAVRATATYDPARVTLLLVEQEQAPAREFLVLGADGTALSGMEAARTRAILEDWARTFQARHGRGILRVRFPGGVAEDAASFEFTTPDAAREEFGEDHPIVRDLATYDPQREALVMIDDPATGTATGYRVLPFGEIACRQAATLC